MFLLPDHITQGHKSHCAYVVLLFFISLSSLFSFSFLYFLHCLVYYSLMEIGYLVHYEGVLFFFFF